MLDLGDALSAKLHDVSSENMKEILTYLEEKALGQAKKEKYEEAMATLEELEQVLESLVLGNNLEDSDFILSNLYNIALCHQRMGN